MKNLVGFLVALIFVSGCATVKKEVSTKQEDRLMPVVQEAEKGDAKAQFLLGLMYRAGHGVPQDDSKAIQWLQKSAEQGYDEAQLYLGMVYITHDEKKACALIRASAEQGNKDAIKVYHQHYGGTCQGWK